MPSEGVRIIVRAPFYFLPAYKLLKNFNNFLKNFNNYLGMWLYFSISLGDVALQTQNDKNYEKHHERNACIWFASEDRQQNVY